MRRMAVLAIFIMVLVLITGCGNQESDSSSPYGFERTTSRQDPGCLPYGFEPDENMHVPDITGYYSFEEIFYDPYPDPHKRQIELKPDGTYTSENYERRHIIKLDGSTTEYDCKVNKEGYYSVEGGSGYCRVGWGATYMTIGRITFGVGNRGSLFIVDPKYSTQFTRDDAKLVSYYGIWVKKE